MDSGDTSWSTTKTILGWVVDTLACTITLPAHCILRLREVLDSIKPTQRRVSLLNWQQLVRELRSMDIAIPAAIDLFSALQEALTNKSPCGKRMHLTKHTFWLTSSGSPLTYHRGKKNR
jgi:hypothetical protein